MPQYFGKLPTTQQPWSQIGAVQSMQRDERGVHFECGDSYLAITVLAPNLIRVHMTPSGEMMPRRSWAVTLDDAEWPIVSFEVREKQEAVEIETEQMRVCIHRQPCSIVCFDKAGRPFAQDVNMGMGWRIGATAAWKQIETDEHFYGFGERTGLLDKLSERKTNWTVDALDYGSLTDEMYQAIHFLSPCVQTSATVSFATPPFGASSISVRNSQESGGWKRVAATWTITSSTVPTLNRSFAPTPS